MTAAALECVPARGCMGIHQGVHGPSFCGAPTSTANLHCTLHSPLLHRLTLAHPRDGRCCHLKGCSPQPTLLQAINQSSATGSFCACESPSHHARLLILQCWHFAVDLDTTAPLMITSSRVATPALAPLDDPRVPTTACFCVCHIQGSDIHHATSCNRLSRSRWPAGSPDGGSQSHLCSHELQCAY
jgi:hypothetical protein